MKLPSPRPPARIYGVRSSRSDAPARSRVGSASVPRVRSSGFAKAPDAVSHRGASRHTSQGVRWRPAPEHSSGYITALSVPTAFPSSAALGPMHGWPRSVRTPDRWRAWLSPVGVGAACSGQEAALGTAGLAKGLTGRRLFVEARGRRPAPVPGHISRACQFVQMRHCACRMPSLSLPGSHIAWRWPVTHESPPFCPICSMNTASGAWPAMLSSAGTARSWARRACRPFWAQGG